MFNCIHLQLIFAFQLLVAVVCYKISSINSNNIINKLDNQGHIDNVKEIVGKKWRNAQANILGISQGHRNSTHVNLLNVMQLLDYGDTISLSRLTKTAAGKLSKEFQPTLGGDYLLYLDNTKVEALDGKRTPSLFPTGDDNLIAKTFNLLRNRSNKLMNERFVVIVNKKIPPGTGLGGGSADAAACIRLVDQIMGSDFDKFQIAREIGSDVPFLLGSDSGLSSSIGVGKGDVFDFIELTDLPESVYLFIPNGHVETAKVYDRIKKLYPAGSKLSEKQLEYAKDMALKNIAKLEFRNDLLPTSCHFSKKLVKLTNILESQNIFHWSMSGSGSACFGFPDKNATEKQITNEINRISMEFEDSLAIIHTNPCNIPTT